MDTRALILGLLGFVAGPFCHAANAEKGSIYGTIQPADGVIAVQALDRAGQRSVTGSWDPGTGRFSIEGLEPETAYDCIIDYRGGRLEGIDLSVPRSDYEEEQPFSPEDEAVVREKIAAMNKFEDRVEILALHGNIQHAVAVLNKLRTKPFYASKPGEVVWRLERWRFERPEETWVKVQDELFTVLYRERLPAAEYEAKSITLDPALGGLRPEGNRLQMPVGEITLPESAGGIRVRGARPSARLED